jgi:hypothetical protein
MNRRTAPKVRHGQVQWKNNWTRSRDDYHAWKQSEIRLDRRAPGDGYRHLLTIAQLRTAVTLLPDWSEAARGLDAIVLDAGDRNTMGWHLPGVVAICAWERDLWWRKATRWFLNENRDLLDLLDVERVKAGGRTELRWTEAQARAFQVLDVLPHELGHHHDSMTTKSGAHAARGEPYAAQYAKRALETMWPRYLEEFDL